MGTIGAVAGAIEISGKLIKDYIDDPRRRAKAIQDVMDELKALKEKAINEKDMEELDEALIAFINSIHSL